MWKAFAGAIVGLVALMLIAEGCDEAEQAGHSSRRRLAGDIEGEVDAMMNELRMEVENV